MCTQQNWHRRLEESENNKTWPSLLAKSKQENGSSIFFKLKTNSVREWGQRIMKYACQFVCQRRRNVLSNSVWMCLYLYTRIGTGSGRHTDIYIYIYIIYTWIRCGYNICHHYHYTRAVTATTVLLRRLFHCDQFVVKNRECDVVGTINECKV